MKLVSYKTQRQKELAGIYLDGKVIGFKDGAKNFGLGFELPLKMDGFLNRWKSNFEKALKLEEKFRSNPDAGLDESSITLLAPVPHPTSCRDAYAFRQHVAAARKNRGAEMVPEFDQFPIFYFTNHNAIIGPGEFHVEADHFNKLDFELEGAIVIAKRGKNIPAEKADSYIAGYTIMNDFSARTLQMEEMKLSLGPAKGKDFATSIGPWIVTCDELADKKLSSPDGERYDLRMTAVHNGKQVSDGNLKDMTWTFAQILERISYGVDIWPGDVIGSGTVGTGCYMELNGTWRNEAEARGEEYNPVWLQPGDEIELNIEKLGTLKHMVKKNMPEYSILAKKKNV